MTTKKRTELTAGEKYEALKGKARDFVDRIARGVDEVVAHDEASYAGTVAGAARMMTRYADEIDWARGLFREKLRCEAAKREQDRKDAADSEAIEDELSGDDELMGARADAIARLRNLGSPSLKRVSCLLTNETCAAVEKLSDATARTVSKIRIEHGEITLIEFWPPVPALAQLAKILGINSPIDVHLTPDDVKKALGVVGPALAKEMEA